MNGTTITVADSITLATLKGFPANTESMADILAKIAELDINVDMISMAPTHGAFTPISFTISDDDLVEMLAFTAELKKDININAIISSANCKISIYNEIMRDTPGIAAKIFSAIRDTNADIRLITTSEVEIAILVAEADTENVYQALKKLLNEKL